jgi:hypothetical protein
MVRGSVGPSNGHEETNRDVLVMGSSTSDDPTHRQYIVGVVVSADLQQLRDVEGTG